jgi:hypothetical protein
MISNITPLRGGSPLLSDIAGQLRLMAKQIEEGDIKATSALFIVPVDHDWPMIFGWGEHLGNHGNIAVCELAKSWFVANMTERKT